MQPDRKGKNTDISSLVLNGSIFASCEGDGKGISLIIKNTNQQQMHNCDIKTLFEHNQKDINYCSLYCYL